MQKDKMIKETGLSETDIKALRESYIEKYASEMGWDRNNLNNEQLNEIIQQPEYKRPGMLFS